MVKFDNGDQVYVDAPDTDNTIESPSQIDPLVELICGELLTIIMDWDVFIHPFISVPVTVYVVVISGVADVVCELGDSKVEDGDQEYEIAPWDDIFPDWPRHMISFVDVTFGNGNIDILSWCVEAHPNSDVDVRFIE